MIMGKSRAQMILASSLLVLAAVALILAVSFPGRKRISRGADAENAERNISPLNAPALEGLLKAWSKTPVWQSPSGTGDLFMAEKYMMYPNGEVTAVDASTMIDGIPLTWLLQYNIDFRSGNVANEDLDGNGFSNRQKYLAHCNPRDPKSHPPYVSRLRLRGVDAVSFKVLFQSCYKLQGAWVFQINLPQSTGKTNRLVRRGENVDGFVVGDFRESGDQSELDFDKPASGIKITAILNKMVESTAAFARFYMLLPGQMEKEIRVEVGKNFELPPEPGVKYVLVNAENNFATIRNLQSGQELSIPPATPEDEKEVLQMRPPARRGTQ
jgi:hypothetical protein